ncbi:hypothetical protein G9A89_020535 [Geosiphon pyriformis]|nr:hypothetical protein G9A89_020535 [Geosiphon pyriformis]
MSEDIKRELEYVKTQYGRCVEELKEFRKGEKGDRLEELKKNLREKEDVDEKQRKKWIEEKEELEEEVKELKKSKDRWELQMEKLQDHFIETNKTEYLVYNAYFFLFSMIILEHLAKRARLDMPDNTSSFVELLCHSLAIGAPEYKSGEDFCSAAGDIWMVGNLFKHTIIYNHISLSSSTQQFREKLMNKNSNSRPTANDALKDEWFNLPEE